MDNKKDELIKTYRNQLNLKNDLLKSKNDEIKKIIQNYEKIIKNLKNDFEKERDIIIDNNLKLIYNSERKLKKIIDKKKTWSEWFYNTN